MPRAKGGFKTRRYHKKILKRAKGYYGGRSKLYRVATEAVDKALLASYKDRKLKKREYRSLWITRINAAARICGITYSQLINGLTKLKIGINRKALADIAFNDMKAFTELANRVKTS
ncbi:MAG TPA: 50S ribosomal protein L20 [Nitrospirae bacterium]|nr:50S ribosomal protein L20 [Nitrospirota bacterium]